MQLVALPAAASLLNHVPSVQHKINSPKVPMPIKRRTEVLSVKCMQSIKSKSTHSAERPLSEHF